MKKNPEDFGWTEYSPTKIKNEIEYLKSLPAELESLRSKLAVAEEALGFYAHQNSWTDALSIYTTIKEIDDDDLYCDKDDLGEFLIGGRRAREALAKIRDKG